jgi:hypothetical protein
MLVATRGENLALRAADRRGEEFRQEQKDPPRCDHTWLKLARGYSYYECPSPKERKIQIGTTSRDMPNC